jgi:hypothetical protein
MVRTPLFLLAALAGCNNSPLVPNGTGGITGQWTFMIDVTVATGVCAGDELDPVATSVVSIVQAGDSVSATGPWGSTSGSETLIGLRSGNTVTVGGLYAEDGGLTTASYTLTVTGSDDAMSGIESWSWSGPGGSCPGSQSSVTATKN